MLKFLVTVFTCLILLSCASTHNRVDDLSYPLGSIKQVAEEVLPAKVAVISPNGREIYTEYFPLPSSYAQFSGTEKGKPKERAKAKVLVLGDRRPYSVEVEVTREHLIDSSYVNMGRVLEFEELLANGIKKALAKRHEGSNLIDDFRPF